MSHGYFPQSRKKGERKPCTQSFWEQYWSYQTALEWLLLKYNDVVLL